MKLWCEEVRIEVPATAKPSVDSVIVSLDPARREMLERLRSVVMRALPDAVETVKWGQPTYVYHGKNLICFMIMEDHLNYGIFVGAKLRSSRLEGSGKGLRHIKVFRVEDIDEKEFARLAKQASKLA